MKATTENKLLSKITFITSLGDFLSLFSTLIMVHEISGLVSVSALSVVVKASAIGSAGVLFPFIASKFNFRITIFATQLISAIAGALLIYHWESTTDKSVAFIFSLLFIQSFLKQVFEGAREARSKYLGGTENEQKIFQADLLQSSYAAQFIGPILAFLLLKQFSIVVPISLDVVSFGVCSLLALFVGREINVTQYKLLAPFRYLPQSPNALRIFLIRSVGMWIPISIFNYIVFPSVVEKFKLEIIDSVWIYVLVGLGSLVATISYKHFSKNDKLADPWRLARIGFFSIAISRLIFLETNSVYIAALAVVLGGFFNGLNAVSTQLIRRINSTSSQLPELIGLEIFIGKIVDCAVGYVCFAIYQSSFITIKQFLLISAFSFLILIPFTKKRYGDTSILD